MSKMHKVLLVIPPITHKEMHGGLAEAGSCEPSLGLCYLASNLRKSGIDVEILDSIALRLSPEQVITLILEKNPEILGITAVTITINKAALLARLIKEKNKDIITVVGGPHMSAIPEQTMLEFRDIDIGVIGEAEETIVELILGLKNKRALNNIRGLVLRGDNGSVYNTGLREPIKDLDSLPLPAWDLLPYLPKYYYTPAYSFNRSPSSSIITTRGCGFNCSFCFQQAFGRKVRSHSVDYTLKIIHNLYFNYGIRDIRILDDNFMLFKNRLLGFCEGIRKEKLALSWSCLARVDMVDSGILRKMKLAGCWQVSFGIESGCQEILNSVNKNISLDKVERAVELTRKSGIKTLGYFMIGFPGEDEETVYRTTKFAKRLGLDNFKMQFLTPYPGSLLYERAQEYGHFDKLNWDKMNTDTEPCFIPFSLSKSQMIYLQKRAFREFYLRPRIIYSYLKMFRRPEHFIKLYLGLIAFLKFLSSKK